MKNANHYFGSGNGSENYYCHKPSLILYTDGVKELAEQCGAYWLIDLIISHQCHKEIYTQFYNKQTDSNFIYFN